MIHDFQYKGNDFYCEQVRIEDIADQVGTPVYVYSYKILTEHLLKLQKAFRKVRPLICFSMKANENLALARALVKLGAGLDIVSGGELFRALAAGCPPSRIVYAGVGKTEREIREAIRAGILLFNVESVPELAVIDTLARRAGKKVKVSLRINPDVAARTHEYVKTAEKESKFGIDFDTARLAFTKKFAYPNVVLAGVHVHIGSQITEPAPFVNAFRKVLIFLAMLEREGHRVRYLNLGGGLGIIYRDEKPQTPKEFARRVVPILRGRSYRVILEPGRFIVGNAGVFVTRVLYVKRTPAKSFAIVDGGMNDLLRPSLYNAYHTVCAARRREDGRLVKADVVGPICESGDFLARDRLMREPSPGDVLAILGAGAYGFSMASNYNARPRAAEVLVRGKRFEVIRRRESYRDLVRGERIPAYLR